MGPGPAFTTEIESQDGVVRVALGGELDFASAPLLEGSLAPVEAEGASTIMLDLRDLRFIDSSGLHELLHARRRAEAKGSRLLIVGATSAAQRLFELTGTQFLIGEEEVAGVPHGSANGGGVPGAASDQDARG